MLAAGFNDGTAGNAGFDCLLTAAAYGGADGDRVPVRDELEAAAIDDGAAGDAARLDEFEAAAVDRRRVIFAEVELIAIETRTADHAAMAYIENTAGADRCAVCGAAGVDIHRAAVEHDVAGIRLARCYVVGLTADNDRHERPSFQARIPATRSTLTAGNQNFKAV